MTRRRPIFIRSGSHERAPSEAPSQACDGGTTRHSASLGKPGFPPAANPCMQTAEDGAIR